MQTKTTVKDDSALIEWLLKKYIAAEEELELWYIACEYKHTNINKLHTYILVYKHTRANEWFIALCMYIQIKTYLYMCILLSR